MRKRSLSLKTTVVLWALIAAALAYPVPRGLCSDSWSEPEVSVIKLAPGTTQKIVSSWRVNKERPSYLSMESTLNAKVDSPSSQGRYDLYKQVYHKEKLVTFYRP